MVFLTFYGKDYPEVEDVDPFAPDPIEQLLGLIKSGDWLDAQEFPAVKWAVPGLIPQGFGLLTGTPKVGKSWAILNMALAVASGGVAINRIAVGPARPVFYLALEDGDARIQYRCRKLLSGARIPPLFHEVTTGITPSIVIPLIEAWLDKHGTEQPLVILDTLGKVMPAQLSGESAYQRDYRVGGVLKAVADRHPGSTLLVVHHTRKGMAADWMDSTSGTNGLNGSADFTLNLHRERKETRGLARVTGRDVTEGEYAVEFIDGRWSLDGEDLAEASERAAQVKATAGLGDRSTEIVAYVGRQVAPVRCKDVEAALDLPDARRYLARLHEAGRLSKVGRGLYTAVPTIPMSQPETPHTTHIVSPQGEGWDNGTVGTGGPRAEDGRPLPCPECGRVFHTIHCTRKAS